MSVKKILRSAVAPIPGGSRWLSLCALSRTTSHASHLHSAGWFRSWAESMPVDLRGEPLPWYTYGAIAFLEPRLREDMATFEYGSGNSTLWWARRVSRVASCEHDPEWFARMAPHLPTNVTCELVPLGPEGDYSSRVARHLGEFDIVVIDGRDRVACARSAPEALKPDGVVVWDNSDRAQYSAGYDHLASLGFRRLDFWGMGPINAYGWCTSVFYRQSNCLGI